MVPQIGYVLFQQVGQLDTLPALIITYVAVNLPLAVWLMRDFFQSLPIELEEMASIDTRRRPRHHQYDGEGFQGCSTRTIRIAVVDDDVSARPRVARVRVEGPKR